MEKQHIRVNFSKRLKRLREELGWSQAKLAQKVDVDGQRISKYERALLYPTAEILIKISTAFNVSLDYLLLDEDNAKIGNLKNIELSKRMEEIDRLPKDKQTILIAILDAFIKQQKLEDLIQS